MSNNNEQNEEAEAARRFSLQAVRGSPPPWPSSDDEEDEARTWKLLNAYARRLSLQAVRGSPTQVISDDEHEEAETKENADKIRREAEAVLADKRERHEEKQAKFRATLGHARVNANPRRNYKNPKMAANIKYNAPPVQPAKTEPAKPGPLIKLSAPEIPTSRPKITTWHFIERAWGVSPPPSPPSFWDRYRKPLYYSPPTTPDSSDANFEAEDARMERRARERKLRKAKRSAKKFK